MYGSSNVCCAQKSKAEKAALVKKLQEEAKAKFVNNASVPPLD